MTMTAAVVREFGKPLVIEEVPVPQPGPGQVLIKYEATGVCHTDLHAAKGDWPVRPNPPFIPGHEGVGYVAKLGAGVKRLRNGTGSACRGCTPPAAAARRAAPAGRRSAAASRIPATRSTALLPNMA
jgi:alcohol dehydrogenase, propanol-preferring